MAEVFCAMPFSLKRETFLKVFNVIQTACEDIGFKAIRIDTEYENEIVENDNNLILSINKGIQNSIIVIGDFTTDENNRINQNVLYEYALAKGMGKHTIAIGQNIPNIFDLMTEHTIQYDASDTGLETFKNNIKNKLEACKKKYSKRQLSGPKPKDDVRAKAIAVLNYKGGVGKTTLTLNLGASFAEKGYKTLIVDLDPQMSLTLACIEKEIHYFWETNHRGTIGDIYLSYLKDDSVESFDKFNLKKRIIKNVLRGKISDFNRYQETVPKIIGLDLLPSFERLNFVETEVLSESYKIIGNDVSPDFKWFWESTILRDLLLRKVNKTCIYDDYDVILFDCPPNLYLSTQNAIMASEYWVSPVIADYLSNTGYRIMRKRITSLIDRYNQVLNSQSVKLIQEKYNEIGAIFMMLEKGGRKGEFYKDIQTYIAKFTNDLSAKDVAFPVKESTAYVPKSTRIAKVMGDKTSVYNDKKTKKFCMNFSLIRDEIISRIIDFPKKGMLNIGD